MAAAVYVCRGKSLIRNEKQSLAWRPTAGSTVGQFDQDGETLPTCHPHDV